MLVGDDNKTNRLVAGKLLETAGVMVDFASNGLEALDVYKALRPTTVFMDVSMPVMDGIDATTHIRKLESDLELAPCKIFALTANTFKEQVEKCLNAGVDGVIGKPVKRNDLIEAISHPIAPNRQITLRESPPKTPSKNHRSPCDTPYQ